MSTALPPIPRLDLLEQAIQDESPDLLAQWLALGHDVNDPRLATPKSDWDPIEEKSRAVAMGQCLSSDWPLMHQLMGSGDADNQAMIQQLIEAGAHPGQHRRTNFQRRNGLEQALSTTRCSLAMLRMMVDAWPGLDLQRDCRTESLLSACSHGDVAMLDFLEGLGGDFTQTIKSGLHEGRGAIHYALRHPSCVRWVLDRTPQALDHAYSDIEGDLYTPLMRAAKDGHLATVELLISRGADPHLVSGDGKTALEIAQHNQNDDVVDWMQAYLAASSARAVISGISDLRSRNKPSAPSR